MKEITSTAIAFFSTLGSVSFIIAIEVANSQIIEAMNAIHQLQNTDLDLVRKIFKDELLQLHKLQLAEAVDLRIAFGEAEFISLGCLAASLFIFLFSTDPDDLGARHAHSEGIKSIPGFVGAFFCIGMVVTGEILLHTVFLEQIKAGLVEDHALFNSVFIGPAIAGAVLVFVGLLTAVTTDIVAIPE